jgi:hypothetical protein
MRAIWAGRAVEEYLPGGRRQELGKQIKTGGLAGAVGADQRVDVAALHLQVDLADGREPLEVPGQAARLQYDVRHCVSMVDTSYTSTSFDDTTGVPR